MCSETKQQKIRDDVGDALLVLIGQPIWNSIERAVQSPNAS
ncbi:hypothetical protein [Arthrobacter sp. RAF14]